MLDLAFFRANFDQVAARLATRGTALNLDNFRELDQKRRSAITEAEELKARKNSESKEIGKLRGQGVDVSERQTEMRKVSDRIAELDEQVKQADEQFRDLIAGIP